MWKIGCVSRLSNMSELDLRIYNMAGKYKNYIFINLEARHTMNTTPLFLKEHEVYNHEMKCKIIELLVK